MESSKIKNNTKKIIQITFIVLLTLGFLLPYYVIPTIMLFIILNIYSLIKQSLFVLENENIFLRLLEVGGLEAISKNIYKYNFIARYFFEIILWKIRKDFAKHERRFEKERERAKYNNGQNRFKQDKPYTEAEISECLKIFGLKSEGLSLERLKSKYKNLAKLYHPDINPGNDDTQIKKINSCKDKLVRFIKNKGF